jgi:hypothetical protein
VCSKIIGEGCRFDPDKDVDTGDSGESGAHPKQGNAKGDGGGEVKGETQNKHNTALVAVSVSLAVLGVLAAVLWFIVRPWCFGKLNESGERMSDRVEVSDMESLASSDGDLSRSRVGSELENGQKI